MSRLDFYTNILPFLKKCKIFLRSVEKTAMDGANKSETRIPLFLRFPEVID